MRTLAGFFVTALLLAVPFQLSAQEISEEQVAKIEAEVVEWAEAWEEGWEPENRCEILRALFHPDHPVRVAGGEPQGRDGWFEFCMSNYANWVSFSGTWGDREVRVISPDAAVLITRYDGTWEFEDGTTNHRPSGVHRILLERAPDGWGATFMQNSAGPSAEG